ncbi:unnamed protein product [Rhizophagus irregularis]|nr:unnamed protein product [Rhizophagus irregularis]CAB5352709.1 unnamed protein product [Rhizophagus irregularis]
MDLYECLFCCETENRNYCKITSKCTHKIVICVECVNKIIEKSINEKQSIEITCPTPGCNKSMDRNDVLNIATKEIFERYDELSYKHAIQKIPEFRWCQAFRGSGQVHEGKDPLFICEGCGAKSCYVHKVIWHEDQTCEQYEKSISRSDSATKAYLSNTKRCPGCNIYIEKVTGCDTMKCECKCVFCMICLHKYPGHKPTCIRG